MSLLDSFASSFGQPSGEGQSGNLIDAALNFVNSQPGGLSGLIQRFHDQGAGDIVQSWIGTGANKSISAETLSNVLGSGPIAQFAEKAGVSNDQLSSLLTSLLPHVVDQATPDGELPADNKVEASHVQGAFGALGGLAALFGKSST